MKNANMKKLLSVLAACALAGSLLAGCGAETEEPAEAGMANPLTEISAEEVVIPMDVPEGAEDVHYFTLDDGSDALVYQMDFTCEGIAYTYRAQATGRFEAYDMSGLNYEDWEISEGAVAYCDAVVETCSEAAAVYWLDVVPGIDYTLGCAEAVSADDILAMANAVFVSAQGEAEGDAIPLGTPEGAENVVFSTEDAVSVEEFDCSGAHFVCRAEYTDEADAYDMSGVEGSGWNSEVVDFGMGDAVVMTCDTASVAYWLDTITHINYTVSCDAVLSAEELLDVAGYVYVPVPMDYSGSFADADGDAVILTASEDGGYAVEIGITRLATFEGEGNNMDGAVEFSVTDPAGGTVYGIFYPADDGTRTLSFTQSDWELLESGTVFEGFEPAV